MFLIAIVVLGLAAFLVSIGTDPSAVPTSAEVASRTMSPYCPGLTLEECPHSQSAVLRAKIEQKVKEGQTNREIDAWLVSNYGRTVLGKPSGLWPLLVPLIFVISGMVIVGFVLPKRLHRERETDRAPDPTSEERTRLASELKRFAEGTE